MVRDLFWKNAFLTHFHPFLVAKWPIFKAFWDFPWAKTPRHGLQMGQNHLFEHHKWSNFPWPQTRHHRLKTA